MPLKIRLQRKGKTDQALYRVVAADQHAKANGKIVAVLGSVSLLTKPPKVKYDKEKLKQFLDKGAQVSATIRKLFSL